MSKTNAILCLFLSAVMSGLTLVPALSQGETPSWHSAHVQLDKVRHSYPQSLWRKVSSSVPRREYSLEDISLEFDSSRLHMLLGSSSCGKSTILKIIRGDEEPLSGQVTINYENDVIETGKSNTHCVYLDTRPSYNWESTVHSIWRKQLSPTLCHPEVILNDLSELMGVSLEEKVNSLSTSDLYLCLLIEQCLPTMVANEASSLGATTPVSSPIVLIDEWLDTETSEVVQNVQKGLEKMMEKGAIVVCVTHKPNLFDRDATKVRKITLSMGKVISISPSA